MFAKGKEAPSVVSTRVLRTHRLNEVESFRLHGKIQTIDNEIQSNYSQLSDEIDGVRRNLVQVKRLKNNLNISVDRRKLLREKGVFVIPSSSSLEDEGVTLRCQDGRKVVIRGKECYDGEIIRRYLNENSDITKQLDSYKSDEEDDESIFNDKAHFDYERDKKKDFQYRTIIPPFHPGSRRNFKDFSVVDNQEHFSLELPPAERFSNKSTRTPSYRMRAQTAVQSRRGSKHGRQRSKSEVSLHSESEHSLEKTPNEESELCFEMEQTSPEKSLTQETNPSKGKQIFQVKDKYDDGNRSASHKHSSRYSRHNLDTPTPDMEDQTQNPSTDFHHQNTRQRKISETLIPVETEKVLIKRPSDEEGQLKNFDNQIRDDTQAPQSEIIDLENFAQKLRIDQDESESANQSLRSPNDAAKIPDINTSVQFMVNSDVDHRTLHKSPTRKHSPPSFIKANMIGKSHIKEDPSVKSYSSKISNSTRIRTDSFNSNANSQESGTRRRKSSVNFLGLDRKYNTDNEEFIYDARPDKALSKGYSTMQMTIGGKQVQLCVPKFSKDDVIERARAKSAAKIADERTRSNTSTSTKSKLIMSKTH